MKSHAPAAAAAALLSAVLMGTLGFFVRHAGTPGDLTAFLRFATGLVIVIPILMLRHERIPFSFRAIGAGLAICACVMTYFLAMLEKGGSLAMAAFIMYLGPLIATVGEILFFRNKPTKMQLFLIAAALAGLVCISYNDLQNGFSHASGSLRCMEYALVSAVFYAAYILFSRRIPDSVGMMPRCFWQFAAGAALAAGVILYRTGTLSFSSVTLEGLPYLAVIGIGQGFLVILLVAYATKYLSAIQFGTLSYLEPMVALGTGIVLYDEKSTLLQGVGFALILGAALIQSFLTFTLSKKES